MAADKAACLHQMHFPVSDLWFCSRLHQGMQPKLGMKILAVCPTLIRSVMSQANGHVHIVSPLCESDTHNVLLHALAGMHWW